MYSLTEYCMKVILPCAFFSILVPIPPYLISTLLPASFLRLIVTGCVSVVTSIVASYFLVLDKSEKEMALSFIKRKRV